MSSSTACDAHRRRCRAQLVWGEDDVDEKKQEILQAVKRDNPEEKLKDFWLRTDELIAVLRHQFRLRKLPHKLARSGCWLGPLRCRRRKLDEGERSRVEGVAEEREHRRRHLAPVERREHARTRLVRGHDQCAAALVLARCDEPRVGEAREVREEREPLPMMRREVRHASLAKPTVPTTTPSTWTGR